LFSTEPVAGANDREQDEAHHHEREHDVQEVPARDLRVADIDR